MLKSKMWESLTLPDLVFFLALHIFPNIREKGRSLCLTRSINISDFIANVVHFSFGHIVM